MAKHGFRLALFATLLALIVVLLGAYTRLTHAGLGCPDWPGCYGFISVPKSEAQLAHAELHYPDSPVEAHKGWNEMIHRYFAGTLGLLIAVLAGRAWVNRRHPGLPLKLPLFLLAVVFAQAAFGMWTVTLKLWPQVVTGHLLGGFATLSLLFLLTLRLSGVLPALSVPRRLQYWATAGLLLVIGQIALGGWVSSNYAAVACIDFPTCHGQWLPPADFANGFHLTQHIGPNYLGGQLDSDARTAIHLTHRIGALLVTVVLLGLAAIESGGHDASGHSGAGCSRRTNHPRHQQRAVPPATGGGGRAQHRGRGAAAEHGFGQLSRTHPPRSGHPTGARTLAPEPA